MGTYVNNLDGAFEFIKENFEELTSRIGDEG